MKGGDKRLEFWYIMRSRPALLKTAHGALTYPVLENIAVGGTCGRPTVVLGVGRSIESVWVEGDDKSTSDCAAKGA